MWKTLGGLLAVFVPMSFLTIGGGQAIIAEVQRQVVGVHHWMTRTEFIDLFAVSRMAPGPGSLYITLIGWHVAGVAGAATATLAIFGPTILLTYAIAHFWAHGEKMVWQRAFESGLRPVAAGMVLASVYVLLTNLNGPPWAQAIALASTAIVLLTRINALLLLALGSLVFLAAHQFFGA
jgi:chromate transporter